MRKDGGSWGANHPGSMRQGALVIETSERLWGSAVHGRKDKNRPWMDKVNCISKSPRHKATRIRMISREAFRLWPV